MGGGYWLVGDASHGTSHEVPVLDTDPDDEASLRRAFPDEAAEYDACLAGDPACLDTFEEWVRDSSGDAIRRVWLDAEPNLGEGVETGDHWLVTRREDGTSRRVRVLESDADSEESLRRAFPDAAADYDARDEPTSYDSFAEWLAEDVGEVRYVEGAHRPEPRRP